MKYALILVVAGGCTESPTLEPWQLDHDRVVAVRANPPHVAPGTIGMLDALIAHADGPVTIEPPRNASAATAPGDLFAAVHFNIDHWQIDGPDEAQLADARAALGLAADAAVPLDVTIELPGPLYALKTVWLGDTRNNPPAPAVVLDPALVVGARYQLRFDPPAGGSVRWLTSCGTLRDDTTADATLAVDEPCDGEVVVVVRDDAGGVAWQVLPIHAR
jgi:hypothetical protein